jgi:hypothetical protein
LSKSSRKVEKSVAFAMKTKLKQHNTFLSLPLAETIELGDKERD